MTDNLDSCHPHLSDQGDTVLKINHYKRVALGTLADGRQTIRKRYSGHSDEHLAANARYVADTLTFFDTHFSEVVRIPKCYGLDVSLHEVSIEYLPALPGASPLTKRTFARAAPFFASCYNVRDDCGFLRPMSQSVFYTPLMQRLIEGGVPLALGLKGDLWQNLCLSDSTLLLADIDSAALEPLGLSEIVMIAEIAASFRAENFAFLGISLLPTCFQYLNLTEAKGVIDAALELFSLRMSGTSHIFRLGKQAIARTVLSRALGEYYKPTSA